ncbi:MAG TPA: type II toxin-antitoxin system VapC family toxin [Chloroflexota bacterium]
MSAEPAAYLDSSAFVKLFSEERESQALKTYLETWASSASSALLRVEGLRAANKLGSDAVIAARDRIDRMILIPIDDAILEEAAFMGSQVPRSLDAIHLATARQLGSDLGVIVTYDQRLAQAARSIGLVVESPN